MSYETCSFTRFEKTVWVPDDRRPPEAGSSRRGPLAGRRGSPNDEESKAFYLLRWHRGGGSGARPKKARKRKRKHPTSPSSDRNRPTGNTLRGNRGGGGGYSTPGPRRASSSHSRTVGARSPTSDALSKSYSFFETSPYGTCSYLLHEGMSAFSPSRGHTARGAPRGRRRRSVSDSH